jgi:hypothetical protein
MANIARRTFITADSLVIPWTMPFINDRRRRLIWFNRLIKIRESRVCHLIAFLQQSRRRSNASQPAPARDLRLTLFTPTRLFRFGDRRVSFGVFSQHINLFISKKTPCTARKVAQRQRTFAHTDQPPHLIPQNARHFTDLALAPLVQDDAHPGAVGSAFDQFDPRRRSFHPVKFDTGAPGAQRSR